LGMKSLQKSDPINPRKRLHLGLKNERGGRLMEGP